MRISYGSKSKDHPLRIICEHVNNNSHFFLLNNWLKDEEIQILFSDENSISANQLSMKSNDLSHLIVKNINFQYKRDILHLLINRFLNLLKEYIINKDSLNRSNENFEYQSLLMQMGRFRENLLEFLKNEVIQDYYSLLIKNETSEVNNKVKTLKTNSKLLDDPRNNEDTLMKFICAPYIERSDEDNGEINENNINIYDNYASHEDEINIKYTNILVIVNNIKR